MGQTPFDSKRLVEARSQGIGVRSTYSQAYMKPDFEVFANLRH
jgi:hypothetical protein